eukprot:TCONS_00017188-protein
MICRVLLALIFGQSLLAMVESQDPPRFGSQTMVWTIYEDAPPGTIVNILSLYVNYENKSSLTYEIDGVGAQILNIIPKNGTLTLKNKVDRENQTKYQFKGYVKAVIGGTEVENSVNILIHVLDVNDNIPKFTSPSQFSVPENATTNSVVFTISAEDNDFRDSGRVEFKFMLQTDVFDIETHNDNTASIIVLKQLDYETDKSYTLKIEATDLGNPPLKADTLITVNVEDIPDTNPIFTSSSPYNKEVPEDTPKGSSLLRIQAIDGDTGVNDQIMYNIVNGQDSATFSINVTSGVLSNSQSLDMETKLSYSFKVQATEAHDSSAFSFVDVTIFLSDVNDNLPTFPQEEYTFVIDENTPKGTEIKTSFSVTDADILPVNKVFEYSLDKDFTLFTIDAITGNLKVNTDVLDYETKQSYIFKVFASELNNPNRKHISNATVVIQLENANDNSPIFEESQYSFTTSENVVIGLTLGFVKATDADLGSLGEVHYRIDNNDLNLLEVNSSSGAVYVKNSLDFEMNPVVRITITGFDTSTNSQNKGQTSVVVMVTDYNDNAPKFTNLPAQVIVKENEVNSSLFQVKANDADSGQNAMLLYTLTNSTSSFSHFILNASSGVISLNKPLDFEDASIIDLAVTAQDLGIDVQLRTTSFLKFLIQDENDNTPKFNQTIYTGVALESNAINTFILQLFASDKDSGVNGALQYAIEDGNVDGTFEIQADGKIFTKKAIDREKIQSFNLTVSVKDGGIPQRSSRCQVLIQVLDQNDEGPVFTKASYTAEISEGVDVGTSVITVTAIDKDLGENASIKYTIASGTNKNDFSMNETTGLVTVARTLDREMISAYTLVLKAQDQGAKVNSRNAILTITIKDVNDNYPEFLATENGYYSFQIYENLPDKALVGYILSIDKDGSQPVYNITHGNHDGHFHIHAQTGVLQTTQPLDREAEALYNLTITASDDGQPPLSTSIKTRIQVLDLNDNKPIFDENSYQTNVAENSSVPAFLLKVSAADADLGSHSVVQYSLSISTEAESFFRIDQNTGELFLEQIVDYEKNEQFKFFVQASDGGTTSKVSVTISIDDINDNTPQVKALSTLINIFESDPIGTELFQVIGEDADSAKNAEISYAILNITIPSTTYNNYPEDFDLTNELLAINESTGVITNKRVINRDLSDSYTIQIGLTDHGTPSLSSVTTFTITVQDRDTHAPIFHNLPNVLNISEATAMNIPIFQVNATDKDMGENAIMNFKILEGSSTLFRIDKNSGVIWTTSKPIDSQTSRKHTLNIQAGVDPMLTSAELTIMITKLPDNLPFFQPNPNAFSDAYTVRIKENAPLNTSIIRLNATTTLSTPLVFEIVEGGEAGLFHIDSKTGHVKLRKELDREAAGATYNSEGEAILLFRAMVYLESDKTKFALAQVTVLVTDYNDETPSFTKQLYKATAAESDQIGREVMTVTAFDKDLGVRGRVSYKIVEGNVGGAFTISDPYSGILRVAGALNVDTIAIYNLTVQATDDGVQLNEFSLSSTCQVEIKIADINDNDPEFYESSYTVNIPEDLANGQMVIKVNGTDKDEGDNGRLWYRIVNGNGANKFQINNMTGEISVKGALNRELVPSYTLTVEAADFGFPAPRKATVSVFIALNDVNDHPPSFNSPRYYATILENQQTGTMVTMESPIKVTDPDSSSQISYQQLNSGFFQINKETGAIYSTATFDRETRNSYTIIIRAVDEGGFFADANVTISILDTNDHAPIFINSSVTVDVLESQKIDKPFFDVGATDMDMGSNSEIIYSLATMSSLFTIDQSSGSIQLISQLDRERQSSHSIIVLATDKGTPSLSGNVTVNINVLDAIDSPPFFTPSTDTVDVLENSTIDQTIFTIKAKDLDLNDVVKYNIAYSSHAGQFKINPTTGDVQLAKPLDRESVSFYRVEFQATDSAGLKSALDGLVINVNIIDINDHAPEFLNSQCLTEVTDGYPDKAILFILNARDLDSGVNAELTYSLSSDINGLLSIDPKKGIVTKNGNFTPRVSKMINFTAHVTDNGVPKLSESLSCSVKVLPTNVNAPKFEKTVYQLTVREDFSVGDILESYLVTGQSSVTYTLFGGQDTFKVYSLNGSVYTAAQLDREVQSFITFNLIAEDSASPPNKGVAIVTVNITDYNDNKPIFSREKYEFDVREDINTTTIVGKVTATDQDVEYFNGLVAYNIQPSQFSSFFRIDFENGYIYAKRGLDRETRSFYEFTVQAADHGDVPNHQAFVAVKISLIDVNDNNPIFTSVKYQKAIFEDTTSLQPFLQIWATDKDIGSNGQVEYSITGGDPNSNFYISPEGGQLRVRTSLDVETKQKYNLTITATDHGTPPLSTQIHVEIQVKDVNDNFPIFVKQKYSFDIMENATVGLFVGGIVAKDKDITALLSTVYYDWNNTNTNRDFRIDEMTGRIKLATTLDYETQRMYSLVAIAYNKDIFEQRSMVTHVFVDFHIFDHNDNAPVFPPYCCNVSVSEKFPVDGVIYTFYATDADGPTNNQVSYVLDPNSGDNEFFHLSTNGQLRLEKPLDRETKDELVIEVQAIDNGDPAMSTTTDFRITVTDVNDVTPRFREIEIKALSEDVKEGTYIATFSADDEDLGASGVVSYAIISGNENGDLVLNSTSGVLETFKYLDYERTPEYKLKVQAKDGGGDTALSVIKEFVVPVININDNIPLFPTNIKPQVEVMENAPIGTSVTTIQANDADGDQIYFFIVGGNSDDYFTIGHKTGELRTNKILDRELNSSFVLKIEASNRNTSTYNTGSRRRREIDHQVITEDFNITIGDENDNPPVFTKNLFIGGISDKAEYGTKVLKLIAIDADSPSETVLAYSLEDGSSTTGKFSIDVNTGWIKSQSLFTESTQLVYNFEVMVKDNGGVGNFSHDSTNVKITVVTDAQRVLITMRTNPDWVRTNQSDFITKLENVTGCIVNIDGIRFATLENGDSDTTRTVLIFHTMNRETGEVKNRGIVLKAIEENYHLIKDFFEYWNVTTYEGQPLPQIAENDDDTILLIVAILVPVFLVLLIIILICCVCCARKRQKEKIKAARADAFASDRRYRSKGADINMQPLHGDFRFSYYNQQAVDPETQNYYTTTVDSRASQKRSPNGDKDTTEIMGTDDDDFSDMFSSGRSQDGDMTDSSAVGGKHPRLGRSFSTFQGTTLEPGDKDQYLDQIDYHPKIVELPSPAPPPPKPPRYSPPSSTITQSEDRDNDSLKNLTLFDAILAASQEKQRVRGSYPNRGLDHDDLESEMTTSVVADDIDDLVTVPVYADDNPDIRGNRNSTNPFAPPDLNDPNLRPTRL